MKATTYADHPDKSTGSPAVSEQERHSTDLWQKPRGKPANLAIFLEKKVFAHDGSKFLVAPSLGHDVQWQTASFIPCAHLIFAEGSLLLTWTKAKRLIQELQTVATNIPPETSM